MDVIFYLSCLNIFYVQELVYVISGVTGTVMPAVDQEHKPEQGPVITLVPVFNRIQGKPVHVQEQTVVRIIIYV